MQALAPREVFKSQKNDRNAFLKASVLQRKALNRNLSWGFPVGSLLPKTRVTLAAQNRESRIARFPESRAWNRQKFRSEKQKNESNRSKVESRKIDSESPSESLLINA